MTREKNKTKTNKKIFFLVVILVAFLAALISMEYGQTVTNGKYTSNIKTIKDFSYDAGNKADFTVWENHIYYCTKDGVQYIDSSGEILWSETYNMALPYMVQNESIIGVSEQKGRVMIVYDSDGKKYSVQTNNPIVSFSLNSEGYSSIITSSDSEYQLEVYNSDGNVIFSGHFQIAHGIPVSSSISKSGNILAVGFLNINEISVSSRVSFYNINEENIKESETSSTVFASFDEAEAVCGVINFIDNNSVAIASDSSLTFVYVNPDTAEKYKEKNKIKFKNQIKQVAFDQNANVYASFGEKIINSGEDALENGTTICYDKNGNQKFSVLSEKKVTGIYPSQNSVLIGMDRSFKNYSLSGKLMWEYNTGQDTKKLLLINNDDLVLFVGTNKASIFRLTDEVLQNQQLYNPDNENKEEETKEEIKLPSQTESEARSEETTVKVSPKSEKPETSIIKNKNTKPPTSNNKNNNIRQTSVPASNNKNNNKPAENNDDERPEEIDPSPLESNNNIDGSNTSNGSNSNNNLNQTPPDNTNNVNNSGNTNRENNSSPPIEAAPQQTPVQSPEQTPNEANPASPNPDD